MFFFIHSSFHEHFCWHFSSVYFYYILFTQVSLPEFIWYVKIVSEFAEKQKKKGQRQLALVLVRWRRMEGEIRGSQYKEWQQNFQVLDKINNKIWETAPVHFKTHAHARGKSKKDKKKPKKNTLTIAYNERVSIFYIVMYWYVRTEAVSSSKGLTSLEWKYPKLKKSLEIFYLVHIE